MIELKQAGFTNEDIKNMDYGQRNHILNYIAEKERIKRIVRKLEIAEAINFAYIGSQPKPKNKANTGARQYASWRRKMIRQAYPDSNPKITVWDRLKKTKKGKMISIN